MPKVVCTALSTEEGPHIEILQKAGFEVVQAPRDVDIYQTANLLPVVKDCVAVIAGSEPWPASLVEACPKLRVLARSGVGYDAVDLPACDKHRVIVATTPGVNHHAVAEHTFALLFGVGRLFPLRDQLVRAATWKRASTPRIMGRTLGIVGLGRIGRAVATRAVGVGMKVVAYDPYPQREFCEQWNIEIASFEDLLKKSDYVSLHLPVSKETTHVMNAKTFAMMKPGSVLINTARGLLVDEPALIAALNSGHLRAAGLDVFEVEPLPATSPLLKMTNVLLSGHLAGLDDESNFDTQKMCAETIVSLSKGGWPTECIRNLAGVTNWKWSEKN
ncbi:phosphoglycerate dehydrogenase [Schlesneria paludicola]|uniref:phosphoglycerate dehydrogenase n=1 Tax=Schlesneria paludicola TaxID=360056 RepID=UPI00029AA162|nr:phosphoglycerate dehydrogenase [Schlesneria paludicola]